MSELLELIEAELAKVTRWELGDNDFPEPFPYQEGDWVRYDDVRSALAALDAAEVPTQPEVCRWEGGPLLSPACSPRSIWNRDVVNFKFCPNCGRKIEVTP